ncbi:MAG: amino acid permease [Rhodospirillales bacterium]
MEGRDITAEGLRIAIGFPSVVMLVIGGIVGVGIFVNPAVVARSLHTPGLALAAWTLGGVVALLGAFVYAELAARIPATGGEYVYLRDTYGPLAGFLFGWATLLVVQTGGMAAVAIVFAKNLDVLFSGALPERAVVVAVLAALAAINCIGVRSGNGVQTTLGVLKIAAIAALIVAGLWLSPRAAVPPAAPPQAPLDTARAFGAAMIPVVFSYGGWQTANYVAGEMKDAGRNLARALLVGVSAVIALYLLVNLACLRSLGVAALGKDADAGIGCAASRGGPARRQGGRGRHRPLRARLSEPGLADRAEGFVRDGTGWFVFSPGRRGRRREPRAHGGDHVASRLDLRVGINPARTSKSSAMSPP